MDRQEALDKIEELKRFINNMGKESIAKELVRICGTKCFGEYVLIEGNLIKIPLPAANTEWTLSAFDYVREICKIAEDKGYDSVYPVHNKNNDNLKFLYIRA